MRYIKTILLFTCLLSATVPAFASSSTAQPLPREAYPPKVALEVPATVGDGVAFLCTFKAPSLSSVSVSFLKRSITAQADENGNASVLLPVPLDHDDADVPLRWKAFFSSMPTAGTVTVKIRKKTYPAQRLTLDSKYVTPDPALQERIARERKLLGAAQTTKTATQYWQLPMTRPVPGKITSWYGLRRILNGQPRNPHKGLDFRAAAGDPIACITDGTVVLVGDFYYPGKCVVVDHGLGVTSIYMHMSEINVQGGQMIKAGETVGRIGSTGRSTGPHLHLGLTVLGHSIDPLPLMTATPEDRAAYEKAFSDAALEKKQTATKKRSGGKGTAQKSAKKRSGNNTAKKPAAAKNSGGKTPASAAQ